MGNPVLHENDLRNLLFGLTQNLSLTELLYDPVKIIDKDQLYQKELDLIDKEIKINRTLA